MGLNYSYRVPRNESYDSLEVFCRYEPDAVHAAVVRYPVSVQRSWDRLDAFVNLTKNWSLKHAIAICHPNSHTEPAALTATDPEALPDQQTCRA